ncbi:Myb domain [Phytophthora cactorum]|nr:Myb domain [Phytophthora cactorum]
MADTATDNQPEPAPPTDSTSADNFGDLLAQLLQSLPAEASRLFLMALSGLSPSESAELCRYVDRLRDEKQFRVIKAMAESTVGAKEIYPQPAQEVYCAASQAGRSAGAGEQNMESHLKRKQALNAASRVKMLNGGANKFHSFNAVVGPDGENADNSNGNTEPVEDPEAPTTKRWTKNQDAALRESVRIHGEKNWKAIAELVPGRNHAQCLQRWRKVLKPGLGCNNWGQIAERIPGRTPKQCRERWKNHLDPAINKGPYTEEEDSVILTAQARLAQQAAMGYNNSALMRQRQMQLLQQQQHLQQAHNAEAVQQLDQQQQMQQMRLHEKMMQQQMQQEDLKAEPYQQNRAMLMGHSPGAIRICTPLLPMPAVVCPTAAVKGQDYNGYDPRYYERQTSTGVASQGGLLHTRPTTTSNKWRETWLQPSAASANSAIDQDGMPRIADNQQQQQAQQPQQPGANGPGIWDPYPRQDAAQLSPLSLQTVEQQPAETVTYEIGASSFGGTLSAHACAVALQKQAPLIIHRIRFPSYQEHRRAQGRRALDLPIAFSLPLSMADAQTLDLFDGLPLDYNFLESGGDASTDGSMNAGSGNTALNGALPAAGFEAPDDQMLLDSDVPGSSPTNMMAPKSEGEDLLTPLSFSFNPNGSTAVGQSYRVAPQHKHKRVRSNPDVLQGFGMANMAPSVITPPVMGTNGMGFSPQHNVMPIDPVLVELPVNPMQFGGTATPQGESFQEMDEFLKELSWSELNPEQQQQQQQQMPVVNAATTDGNGVPNSGASPVAYRTQRIQEGVNELKMKRKRPVNHHSRHHSNPVDLLYNLDQFRVLAQQNKEQQQVPMQVQQQVQQQQQNMNPNQGYPNPFASFQDPTNFPAPPQPNMQQFQFQVPPQIASGAVHSLHGRRSSLGSNLPPRAATRRRGANRSSGLSMDMSQMNLGFLSVPEEPSMADLNPHRSPPRRSGSGGHQGTQGHAHQLPHNAGQEQVVAQCDDHEPPQLPAKGEVKSEEEVEAEPLGL